MGCPLASPRIKMLAPNHILLSFLEALVIQQLESPAGRVLSTLRHLTDVFQLRGIQLSRKLPMDAALHSLAMICCAVERSR
jgi:hypothetical protein